jgi:hypothetical protein
MARKVDQTANLVFNAVNGAGAWYIYDRGHPDYAGREKIDLAWERISHKMKGAERERDMVSRNNQPVDLQAWRPQQSLPSIIIII